jgi:SAM-dependent methyltransferase
VTSIKAPADAADYFSRDAAAFHASYEASPNRLERLRVWADFLDRYSIRARTAYDVGCGTGILACQLGRRGITTCGLDASAGMLEIARQLARSESVDNVRFDEARFPLLSSREPVDLVVSSSLLEYLVSTSSALRSFAGLLVDDGVLVCSVSNADSVVRKLVRLAYRLIGRPSYMGLIRSPLTAADLRQQLEAAGFVVLELAYLEGADRLNRLLRPLLGERRSSNMLIVAARRAT